MHEAVDSLLGRYETGRERDDVTQVYTADPDNLRIQLQDVSFCGGLGTLGSLCTA